MRRLIFEILDRSTAFFTCAVPLIVGEIRRHLRDSGPMKVSRIYKRQGLALMHEKNRIMQGEGREAVFLLFNEFISKKIQKNA